MSEREMNFTEREMWGKYEFLTEEMKKFLENGDIDTFLDLLEQRDFFEKKIMTGSQRAFVKSEEGQDLLEKLRQMNLILLTKVQQWTNAARGNRNAGRAYESLGVGSSSGWSRNL